MASFLQKILRSCAITLGLDKNDLTDALESTATKYCENLFVIDYNTRARFIINKQNSLNIANEL